MKLGVDPTAPDIHLGHTVVLGKLREFQDAGHLAVLIIGDWTARVGDPCGRSSTRPMLGAADIERNAATYRSRPSGSSTPTAPRSGPTASGSPGWGWRSLPPRGSATVNQILRRNDFAERMAANQPVSVLELLYPLMQAYDSVMVDADVELGGTDQLFNLMLAREVQAPYGQSPRWS